MASTTALTDAEREIATIRCLVAQQIHAIDRHPCGPERRAADLLLRQLLRREEDLRRNRTAVTTLAPKP